MLLGLLDLGLNKMQVSFVETKNNCPIAVVDNFYSSGEVECIKKELTSLFEIAKLKVFTNNAVSKDENNNPHQQSNSMFLDELFSKDRSLSSILKTNRKLFDSEQLKEILTEKSLFYSHIYNSNKDATLVNFYSSSDFYKEHKDFSCFTALSFFGLESFSGGDLCFPEYGIQIKPVSNRVVIFPGFLLHSATTVESGIRVSIAQFINYR